MKKLYTLLTIVLVSTFMISVGLNCNNGFLETIVLNFKDYNYSGILISFGILVLCLVTELFFLPFKKSSLYKIFHPDKSIITDIVIGLSYTLGLFFFVKAIFLISLGEAGIAKLKIPTWKEPVVFSWSYIPSLLIFIVIADLLKYFFHRLCHEISFLWEIHKFHHASTSFVLLTGQRVHPLEHILQKLFVSIPLIALGISIDMYLSVIFVSLFIDKLQHSMLNWDYGVIGKYFIYAPIGHRIHHSKEEEHFDKNYGDLFVFWDRIFGTYYKGENINREVGVTDNWMNKEGIIYDLWHSLYLSLLSFIKSVKTWTWRAPHLKNKSKN